MLPPFVFRQANLDGFDKIVAELRAAVPSGARVVEWYAGVGVLGLSLAADAAFVRCSDVNPPREAFEASRALLPADARDRVSYAVGAAKERLDDAVGADVALVDPPRKGLAPELLAALCDDPRRGGPCASVRTLLYVSCGVPALTHDLDAPLAAGCWRVRGDVATAHVLFPGANHIETVVVFDREPAPSQARAEGRRAEARAASKAMPAGADDATRGAPPRRPRARDPAKSPRARRLAANKRRAKRRPGGPDDPE